MDRGYPHNLKEKLLSEIKLKEVQAPETKQQGRKRDMAFRDTILNNYSPKAKLILLNNLRDEVEGIIQQY